MDHSGDDLAQHPNTSPVILASLCANLTNCVAFNWQPDGSSGWLKSGASADESMNPLENPQICFYAACELYNLKLGGLLVVVVSACL